MTLISLQATLQLFQEQWTPSLGLPKAEPDVWKHSDVKNLSSKDDNKTHTHTQSPKHFTTTCEPLGISHEMQSQQLLEEQMQEDKANPKKKKSLEAHNYPLQRLNWHYHAGAKAKMSWPFGLKSKWINVCWICTTAPEHIKNIILRCMCHRWTPETVQWRYHVLSTRHWKPAEL